MSDMPVLEELVFAWTHENINRVVSELPLSTTQLGSGVPASRSIHCSILSLQPIDQHVHLGCSDVSVAPLLDPHFLGYVVSLAQTTKTNIQTTGWIIPYH
jgi:hypothetical protein